MEDATEQYTEYFRQGKAVKVGIHMPDNMLLEDHAVIMAVEENRMKLELWGSDLTERGGAATGTGVTIIADAGYSVHCAGTQAV